MEKTLSNYTVKAGTFEGPFDLLLSLIESRKLFVNEISLAEVTNDYINHTKNLSHLPMSEATNFIAIAATLILIKSRSLLPNLELTTDEKEKIGDLELRLKLYQMIKEIGVTIGKEYGKKLIFHSIERPRAGDPIFLPTAQITLENLRLSAEQILDKIPKRSMMQEVIVKNVVSIEEMITNLADRITKSLKMSFKEFSGGGNHADQKEKKVYVIVSFLAMLELVRQGIVDVMQENSYGDMEISHLSDQNI